ncbi:roadblock/LC7 domain-containing protein [Saccharopolyspora sp. ASAGF58]|uniref:roadblock/LC7 domain-containing protein n=1 Tax=Saccharopolyspora sp. ASAGF58 TaxID=2719023 RepID=UPI00143FCAF8|nr:roadblock/LC7 domain-containing protein [Saccharopolyspora sp. ASAGF58]QIZ38425.1 roadblock/LC7 domain-containing protein [Saccharopolyspora sp. ASAGF58]
MFGTAEHSGELSWLLDELVHNVPRVTLALLLSNDGLAMAVSSGVSNEDGEHLAVVASALHSLAKGTGRHFDAGSVRQAMIELDGGYLFVVAAGGGTCLTVFAEAGADIGLVAYEMARLLTSFPRLKPGDSNQR